MVKGLKGGKKMDSLVDFKGVDNGDLFLMRSRLVRPDDGDVLVNLYRILDSCNAKAEEVPGIIEKSQRGFDPRVSDPRITLIAEAIDQRNRRTIGAIGTATLIKLDNGGGKKKGGKRLGNDWMYVREGSELVLRERDLNAVEFGGLVREKEENFPDVGNYEVGKTLSTMRAIIARRFAGVLGVEDVVVDFLPPYEDDSKKNAFWEMILGYIVKMKKVGEAKLMAARILNKGIQTDDELLNALVRDLNREQRNFMVGKFFPKVIGKEMLTEDVERVLAAPGGGSRPALEILKKVYGQNFVLEGYFPVDGGNNYRASTFDGASNERTVQAFAARESVKFDSNSQRGVVFKDIRHDRRALHTVQMITTPGIFGLTSVHLPWQVMELMDVSIGDYVTYSVLPQRSLGLGKCVVG